VGAATQRTTVAGLLRHRDAGSILLRRLLPLAVVVPLAFALALVFLAIAGTADMFSAVFRATIVQLGTPDELRGRVTSINVLVVTGGPRLGDIESALLAALIGPGLTVVIGGLFSSTFLTLLVIPAVYFLVDGVKRRVSRARGAAPATTPEAAATA